ncbi:hypothetical protein [Halomicrobium salinisoli]|nr:hypothetical protein [Halomicrobium salinisoli]
MNKFQHVKLFADDLRRNVRTRTASPVGRRDTDDDEEQTPAKVIPTGF